MHDYSQLSDEQLQKLAITGDTEAEEALTKRYSRLVSHCAQPYFISGGENADLTQEGMVGLLSAIREYSADRSVPFGKYAELCIRRRIFSAIRAAARQKHEPLNNGISLEETLINPPRENTRIVQDQRRVPEEQVLARERAQEFYQNYLRCLSPFEQEILHLYLDGFSYRSMAEKTGREEKSVDNAVQRIRRKLARTLLSGENSES